jgi:YVTN family beta-propeller protein
VVSPPLPTASVNQLLTTADGNYALAVGFNGSLISFATQSIVGNTNQFVSCTVGAVSPVAQRAAMFSDTFGEDMVIVETDATPALISAGPTGPAPEGDKTRVAALTAAGNKAVAVNQFSQTATVVDVATAAQQGLASIGRRPGGIAISPDGSKAVIANRDGAAVSVVNLGTLATTNVPISTRGDQVRVSPDGQYAYIAVVVSDGVWRVNLNTNTVAGPKITTGDMGSFFQGFNSFSGMTLSHDGATLITCDSFTHQVSVINTATWTLAASVPLGAGNFPVRAVFSPDDSKIYVSNRDSDRISVINNAGAASAVTGTIIVGDFPTEMAITPDGATLYVMNTGTPTNVGVVNTTTLTQTSTISFATNPTIDGIAVSPDGSRLYISHSNGTYTIGMGGFTIAQSTVLSTVDTATNAVVDTMAGPNLASGLAMAGNGSALAMPNLMSEGLTLVSLETACYADCDGVGGLTANDFACFLNAYTNNASYADCDGVGGLTANDFVCFISVYAAGCS